MRPTGGRRQPGAMTSTDFSTPPGSSPASARVLRRSRTDRVGAGVAGGLGAYFGVDPVLFRVLFAVAAFFGGAGVIAYLLAWAVIPEEGSERAGIVSWIGELRRRRVPVWAVVVAAGPALWLVSFIWWLPLHSFPVALVVVLIVVAVLRSGRPERPAPDYLSGTPGDLSHPPVNLSKEPAAGPAAEPVAPPMPTPWRAEGRAWVAEAKAASRERGRRAF